MAQSSVSDTNLGCFICPRCPSPPPLGPAHCMQQAVWLQQLPRASRTTPNGMARTSVGLLSSLPISRTKIWSAYSSTAVPTYIPTAHPNHWRAGRTVETLVLAYCRRLTDISIDAIATHCNHKLRHIILWGMSPTAISDAACARLVTAAPNLATLDVRCLSKVGTETLKAVASSESSHKISFLGLAGCRLWLCCMQWLCDCVPVYAVAV